MTNFMGDAELDEGNVYECLQEGWKHDLRNFGGLLITIGNH